MGVVTVTTIELPWPSRDLSPNSRAHRMAKARAVKKYRTDCHYAAMACGLRRMVADTLLVTMTFRPPLKRHHDQDNLIARSKAAIDALADVTGIDDRHFRIAQPVIGEPYPPFGKVIVELEAI